MRTSSRKSLNHVKEEEEKKEKNHKHNDETKNKEASPPMFGKAITWNVSEERSEQIDDKWTSETQVRLKLN